MKYLPLLWGALWRRKLRTWLTLIAMTVAFFLFGVLQGVNLGIEGLYDLLGTERLNISARINNSVMPLAHRAQIAAVPGITAVSPLAAVPAVWLQTDAAVVALAVDARAWFTIIYPQFEAPPDAIAAMERIRNGAIVGKALAEKHSWKVGDRVPLQALAVPQNVGNPSWEFEIVGIYEIPRRPNWATNMVVNFDYVNAMRATGSDQVQRYIARVADEQQYAQIANAIDEHFANSSSQTLTRSEEDFARSLLAQVGNISYLLNGVAGAVLFTLFFLTANTMMLSVRERTPEFAALKTLGFNGLSLLALVLAEVLLLYLTAGVLGLGSAAMVFPRMMSALGPEVGLEGMRILPAVYGWGLLIAVLAAVFSGLPPALRATGLRIVDGLANR